MGAISSSFFPQLDHFDVIEIRRDVQELLGLLLDGLDHFRVGVAGGVDGDAGHEVEKTVAVHIPDFATLPWSITKP